MDSRPTLESYEDNLAAILRTQSIPDVMPSSVLYAAPVVVMDALDVEKRRAHGIFFTHPTMASQLASHIQSEVARGCVVMDPGIGGGDLLLACARHLPRRRSVDATLRLWSELLRGYERHAGFLKLARLRLAVLAKALHRSSAPLDPDLVLEMFPDLRHGDFLQASLANLTSDTCVITNPPFNYVRDTALRNGRISAAALFLVKLYNELPDGAHIVGVFPEVLRCGSTYDELRAEIASSLTTVVEESLGRFARRADVDVYLGYYRRRQGPVTNLMMPAGITASVSDFFSVQIGYVVPHRAPNSGQWTRYVTAKNTPTWDSGFTPTANRRHRGPTVAPPFVIVRRTSSPSQRHRAVGTIIVGERQIAVENHLIVLKPNDGKLETCKRLLETLRDPRTSVQLNASMRCRHLTKASLQRLRLSW